MKRPQCPICESYNIVMTTDVEEVKFTMDEDEIIDFDPDEVQEQLDECLRWSDVSCECQDCGEVFDYEDDGL